MAIGLKPVRLLFRDGTAQQQRLLAALSPGYVAVDERTLEDLLWQAQELAKELIFFDENNRPAGNWEGFLVEDLELYNSSSEEKKTDLRKKWIADIIAYTNDPGRFVLYPEKTKKLSKPHLALFVSFLQLLGFVKEQLNGFTKKHLDFYYYEVLGLSKKAAVPDLVNVIIELAGDVKDVLVEKGTLLSAGKDSLGKELLYKTVRDTVINRAQAETIKTLFVDKKTTGLAAAIEEVREAKFRSKGDADAAFGSLLKLALGKPAPGDDLPLYNIIDCDIPFDPERLMADLASVDPGWVSNATAYLNNAMQLSVENFSFVLKTYQNERATAADWSRVENILDSAYKAGLKKNRREQLKKRHRSDAANGFLTMLKEALGDPAPGDNLPAYKTGDKTLDLDALFADINSGDGSRERTAAAYINDEMHLSAESFKIIYRAYRSNTEPTGEEWNKVYNLLEEAARTKRKETLPSPILTIWRNIYAVGDARASAFNPYGQEGKNNLQFNTFGKFATAAEKTATKPVSIGFAVSSPQLVLTEGKRTITLTIALKEDTPVEDKSPDELQSFSFFISHEKGWRQAAAKSIAAGRFMAGPPVAELSATISNSRIVRTDKGSFDSQADKNRLIADTDGKVYRIAAINDAKQAALSLVYTLKNKPGKPVMLEPAAIYANAIQVVLELDEDFPPVKAPGADSDLISIKSPDPVVCMVLNNDSDQTAYPLYKDWKLDKLMVSVSVEDIRAIRLQNDNATLNPKKPFNPFGAFPHTGDTLYFGHSEICEKKLDTLQLNLTWLNPPANFGVHYGNYHRVLKNTLVLNENTLTNSAFNAVIRLVDKNALIPLAEKTSLFSAGDATIENRIELSPARAISTYNPTYRYIRQVSVDADDEVVNWDRYFSLELGSPDFQHELYPSLLTKQAFSDAETKALTLNLPYTPRLKTFTIGYSAHFEVGVTTGTALPGDRIFHITPFGFKPLAVGTGDGPVKRVYFFPYFENEGELLIGLSRLAPPQNLTLLFQMAEGSANPDREPVPVAWSYLSQNEWKALSGTRLLQDTTNGLLNTGIIELSLPDDATATDTLLTGGLHWLRASIPANADAFPDTVEICTQVVEAIFHNQQNEHTHLETHLPAGSIKSTIDTLPEISKIVQPYTSSKGKPAEKDTVFYNRVSERLRHKGRALSMWDYERLVLEQFPEVYKAKCMPADINGNTVSPGTVDVIVIPDIKGKLPFNPFQPKVPANTVHQIQQYLDQRIPAFATVRVKNPAYRQIKTRFAVKMKKGCNEGFYLPRLHEELKRYLAPWAYDEGADIVLGGKVYGNVIVNFIAERPYIDYVAGMKLFQSDNGIQFVNARLLNKGENLIQADQPDVILVSALQHEIDLIREKSYEEKSYEGVGYLKIGLDFEVG